MDVLVSQFKRRLTNITLDLVRECINEVTWNERLSAVIGPRGVGKTTLISCLYGLSDCYTEVNCK